jgi:hypothetical protein
MPPLFEWEFEDDPEPSASAANTASASDRRRRWMRRGLVVLLLLAVIGLGVRGLIAARQRAMDEVEAELRATVQLELRSIESSDVELFNSVQDPSDTEWRAAQMARFFSAADNDYTPAPGMVPARRPSEIAQVDLAGRSAQVEVTFWFDYAAHGGSRGARPDPTPEVQRSPGQGQVQPDLDVGTYPFTSTWFYQRTEQGDWFHVAPQDQAWRAPYSTSSGARRVGATPALTSDGQLTVTAPTRSDTIKIPGLEDGSLVTIPAPDWSGPLLQVEATQSEAPLIDPVAVELGRLVSQACDGLNCPFDARYRLRFDDVPAPQRAGNRWTLPTTYLAGRPKDKSAQSAWTHALQLWIVEALVRAQFDAPLFDSCERGPNEDVPPSVGQDDDATRIRDLGNRVIYQAFVERLQAELGLVGRRAPDRELLADAVARGKQHALEAVWGASVNPEDVDLSRLFYAEAMAVLDMLEEELGTELLLGLMPRLLERPGALDIEALYDLDRESPNAAWYVYLSGLTGEPIVPLSTFPIIPLVEQDLEPAPSPPIRALAPTDQIALACGSRIWVGQADGSELVPLTQPEDRFTDPHWSPDGRWLLTRRLSERPIVSTGNVPEGKPAAGLTRESGLFSTLYLMDTQDSHSRALAGGPAEELRFRDLSPDGRLLIYETASDVRAVDVETGETRRLPAEPVWSPAGEELVFSAGSPMHAWLADADWGVPRQIVNQPGLAWPEAQWSPDNQRLAMNVNRGYPYTRMVAVYDLADEQITAQFVLHDLIRALARSDGDYLSNGATPTGTDYRSATTVWPAGWSADGSHLLVRGDWTKGPLGELDLSLLVAFPVDDDGSAPRVIAYGQETFMSNISWSPADPGRLLFKWRISEGEKPAYETHLIDLETGPLYTATDAVYAAWAPDGAGLAVLSADAVTFVDSDGRERFSFEAPDKCTDIAWNPAFDYGGLATR